jgi:hypothetical protein
MRERVAVFLVWGFVVTAALAACSTARPTPVIPPPAVVITSPASGHSVTAGVDVPINSTANDAQGVVRVELWVDGSLYRVDTSPEPEGQTTFVASQPWHAAGPGAHRVVVRAYSKSAQVAESLPITVNVVEPVASVPTDTPTPVPSSTATRPPATDTPPPVPPTATATASPQPTDTPSPAPPVEPTDTPVPPTPTVTATSTTTPTPTPTVPTSGFAVPEPLAAVWVAVGGPEGRLGEPVAGAVLDRWAADQFFEGGFTFWRNNESAAANQIFVLFYGDGSDETQGRPWLVFEDEWHEGLPTHSCPEAEANGDLGPLRGFGKVWCENAEVRQGMRQPLVPERGAEAGWQDFQGGTILWIDRVGYLYALFDDGDWQRFED